ncbi:MAG: aldehyde dehydrogenase family protein [Micrococcaceae bacterium]
MSTNTSPTTPNLSIQRAEAPFAVELPRCAHYIDGAYSTAAPHGTAPVIDPARGIQLTEVPSGGAEEVDAAVAAAEKAQPDWAALTPRDRATALLKLADLIEADAENLQRLEALNCGKPAEVAEDDIASVVDTFRFMAGAGRAPTSLAAGDYVADTLSVILREPLGVVGLITPWNYPLLMVAWKVAPALMVGNAVVLKPSEITPLTTLRLVELAEQVLPAGVFNVVLGKGSVVGQAISSHPGISLVALTGSVRAGVSVASSAAESLARVHLELGGKAPVVVCEDADLDHTAEVIAEAGFWNSGQECGAACRVIVHESVADALTEKVVAAVSAYQLADPEVTVDGAFGPIIYQGHFERVTEAIAAARERGAEVLLGGGSDDSAGYWVEPTVLAVETGDPITREEVFGPVVTIERFTDLDEATARANDTEYGLTASVFTRDVTTALNVSKRLDFGSVNVNTHLALPTEMPWSGFKKSGYGRDLSAYALDDYSRVKHVAIQH